MKTAWFQTCSRPPAKPRTASPAGAAPSRAAPTPSPIEDDADVLDAVIREQPLEIVLRERKHDAEDPGRRSEGHERETHHVGYAGSSE